MALVYALAVIGACGLVWTVYKHLVPSKAHDLPEYLDVEADERTRATSELTVDALAAHLTSPVLRGNSVELLVNGVRIFPAMLDAIRRAEKTINFLTFIYWQGAIAQRFAEELAAAARRGVEVRVLLDAFGAAKMKDELVAVMRDAGCRIAHFHPLRVRKAPHYNHRTHRKILVVDGTVGFTGGVGIADEWTGDADGDGHWRDDHFRVAGPAVRYLQGALAENWREATGEVLTRADIFPAIAPAGDASIVPIKSAPGGTVSQIGFAHWLLLRSARQRAWITTPYFLPSRDLEDELVNAAARGVDVVVLVPGDNDDALVQYGSHTYYPRLIEAGVRVYEYVPTMIHAKTIVLDHRWSVIGSSNLDNRSFDLNYEIVLCVEDRAFNAALARQFEEDLGHARRVTPALLEQRGLASKIRNHAALVLRPQL